MVTWAAGDADWLCDWGLLCTGLACDNHIVRATEIRELIMEQMMLILSPLDFHQGIAVEVAHTSGPIIANSSVRVIERNHYLPNVEVTGDPLEAACGAGMFVV